MSSQAAGASQKSVLSSKDQLAPLPMPTGQKPSDSMGMIWRKNEVYLDISDYTIGSAVAFSWFQLVLYLGGAYLIRNLVPEVAWALLMMAGALTSIAVVFLTIGLRRPTPMPVRFNRQRREACVLKQNGEYWIVPWETVTATALQASVTTQGGRITHGFLVIRLDNPDPNATKGNDHILMGFYCGGGETAMALWECVRSYMEVGPEAVDFSARFDGPSKGFWASYVDDLKSASKRKGWFLTLLWDGLICILVFNVLLANLMVRWKLSPLPDPTHPDIIEWSKPLPPEQWAKPSQELQAALAAQQATQGRH